MLGNIDIRHKPLGFMDYIKNSLAKK